MVQILLEFLHQFLAEVSVMGQGGLLVVTGTNPERNNTLCTIVGFTFWALLGISIWWFLFLLSLRRNYRLLKTFSSKAARNEDPEAYPEGTLRGSSD